MPFMTLGSLSGVPRFTLLLEPRETQETFRKWGLKWRVIKRELRPAENVRDYLNVQLRAVVQRVRLPEKFDPEEVIRRIHGHVWERLQEDEQLRELLTKLERSKGKRDSIRALVSLFEIIDHWCDPQKFVEADALAFMSSDLDLSFFVENARFYRIMKAYTMTCLMIVRRKAPWLRTDRARSIFTLFRRRFEDLKNELSHVLDHFEPLLFSWMALRLYLLVCNASTYEDILQPKFISLKNVERSEYQRLLSEFLSNLDSATCFFMERCPELFTVSINPENPVARMMRNILVAEAISP